MLTCISLSVVSFKLIAETTCKFCLDSMFEISIKKVKEKRWNVKIQTN